MSTLPNQPVSSPNAESAPSPHPGATKNMFGRVSLILGIVIMLAGAASFAVQTQIIYTNYRELMPIFGPISALTQLALASVGLIFGIVGASRRGMPKLAAGVGLGIAASSLFGMLASYVVSTIFSIL